MRSKSRTIGSFLMILLFLIFLAIYFAGGSGYYDYEMQKKTILTDEAMKQFERDIAEGKDVDINDYLENVEKDYRTDISRACAKVSKNINKYFKIGFETVIKVIASGTEE
ncbi:MAG: hypothetical protein Q4G04_02350 [bacterium]|nr:hypothetical protein [bacterium]